MVLGEILAKSFKSAPPIGMLAPFLIAAASTVLRFVLLIIAVAIGR